MTEEDEEKGYFEPMLEIDVNGIIIESHSDFRYPVVKKRINIMPQKLCSTAESRTNFIVANSTRKINYIRLSSVNHARVKRVVL